jgi:hypothetical protein
MFTLGNTITTRDEAQLWFEKTFDLSTVTLLGIWDSPFRGQFYVKVMFMTDPEVRKSNEAALNRLSGLWPEEKRVLLNWAEVHA